MLEQRFSKVNFLTTHRIRKELLDLRMKNSADAERYVAQHRRLVHILSAMPEYSLTEIDVVSSLLEGFPDYEEWHSLKTNLLLFYHKAAEEASLTPVNGGKDKVPVYRPDISGPVEHMYRQIRLGAELYLSSRRSRCK